MFKTGNVPLDLLSGITLIFPLLPVVCVLLKRLQGTNEAFPLLIIVCVLGFIKDFFPANMPPGETLTRFFVLMIDLVLMICLVLIFRLQYARYFQTLALLVLVASVSMLVTCYFIRGFESFASQGNLIISSLLICYSLLTLINYFSAENIYLAGEPGFWIAAGSFFYWSVQLLITLMTEMKFLSADRGNPEVVFLVDLSSCLQFSMYCCAALFYLQNTPHRKEL